MKAKWQQGRELNVIFQYLYFMMMKTLEEKQNILITNFGIFQTFFFNN